MGLEETVHRVYDDVGVVELCAIVIRPNIDCPIDFSFDITFETKDGSAGIIKHFPHHRYLPKQAEICVLSINA